MDRKVLFQAILWSMAVYFLLMVVLGRIYPPQPPAKSPTTQPAGQVTTQPGPEAPRAGPADEVASQPAEGGQPRDHDTRACYVVVYQNGESPLDRGPRSNPAPAATGGFRATVEFVRVEYDIEKAVKKVLAVDELDDFLGTRLLEGR